MPTTYTETPDNFNEIGTFVEKEINGIKKIFYLAQRVIMMHARFKSILICRIKR